MVAAAELWEEFQQAKADGAPKHVQARLWDTWFARSCAEGNPPDRLRRDAPTAAERFDAHVIDGLDGCLIWDGPIDYWGIPRIPGGPRKLNARKFALERRGVTVRSHRRVIPTCGNARCVNADHLYVEEHHWARSMTDEQMLARLQIVAMRLGHTPGPQEWKRLGENPAPDMYRWRFGSWRDAYKKAGLEYVSVMRGVNQNVQRGLCASGRHRLEGDNVGYQGSGGRTYRFCRACKRERGRDYERRKRQEARNGGDPGAAPDDTATEGAIGEGFCE